MLIKYNNYLLRLKYNKLIKYPSQIYFSTYCYIYTNYDIRGEYFDVRQYFKYNNDLYFICISIDLDNFYNNIRRKEIPPMPRISIAGILINIKLEENKYIDFIKSYLNILKI